jgi:hypothetical protein
MAPLLNNQWEKFCLAYFKGKNASESAIEAGYSPKAARPIANYRTSGTRRFRQDNERYRADGTSI